MLKKLLASALAVATVASCAYVPSALASAATTKVTVTEITYQNYLLDHPETPAAQDDITLYATALGTTYTISKKVKPEENNKEFVESKLNAWLKEKVGDESCNISAADSTAAVKNELVYLDQAGANTYVATIIQKKAVIVNTYKNASATMDDVKGGNLKADASILLGYYNTPVDQTAVLQKVYNEYTSQAKMAGFEFTGWDYDVNTGYADTVSPTFASVDASTNALYENVKLVRAMTSVADYTAYELETGLYEDSFPAVAAIAVPKNADNASRVLAITNYLKTNDAYAANAWTVEPKVVVDGKDVKYVANAIRLIDATNKTYAITYAPKDVPAGTKDVDYTLSFKDTDGDVVGTTLTGTKKDASEYVFTTDANEVYAIVKGANDKATLDEYLASFAGAGTQYKWTTDYITRDITNKSDDKQVDVVIKVEKYTQRTVYSYTADGAVKKDTENVFLSAKQWDEDAFGHIKATADDLGIPTEVVINGVPATFAYAERYGAAVKTTYQMGDATAAITDFATATGEFDAKAYFNRAAKAGDVVTLKVSFNEIGDAKVLDLKKVSVEYNGTVGATKGDQFTYSERYSTEVYKDGFATEFTLAAGTNIITATVKYDGKVIGTLAPFYATVAE